MTLIIPRRGLLAFALAVPALVSFRSLMPVKVPRSPFTEVSFVEYDLDGNFLRQTIIDQRTKFNLRPENLGPRSGLLTLTKSTIEPFRDLSDRYEVRTRRWMT